MTVVAGFGLPLVPMVDAAGNVNVSRFGNKLVGSVFYQHQPVCQESRV